MTEIKEFLLQNEYEISELDNVIEGSNEFLHILIKKQDDGKYLVRNAIACYFDRWANSGIEFYPSTSSEVIEYFSTKEKCITDAVSELVESIIEESCWNEDNANIKKMIEFLYLLARSDKN